MDRAKQKVPLLQRIHRRPGLSVLLHRRVPSLDGLAVGELLLLAFCAAAVLLRIVWETYTYPGVFNGLLQQDGVASEESAPQKAYGFLTSVLLGLVLLPIARLPVFSPLLGISFERGVRYHRYAGWTTVFCATIHGFNVASFRGVGVLLPELSVTDQTSTGMWAWYAMVLMLLTSLPSLRRRVFHLFYRVHVPASVFVVVAGVSHHVHVTQFVALGVALYVADFLLWYAMAFGLIPMTRVKAVTLIPVSDELTRIDIQLQGPNYHFHGGQFFFLNIPQLSWTQWHPFSACIGSKAARVGQLRFFVKVMHKSRWTSALHQLASRSSTTTAMTLRLVGPLGIPSVPLGDYKTILFIVGGIGVTPMVSMAIDVLDSADMTRIVFVWTVRRLEHCSILQPELARLDEAPNAELRVYVTRMESPAPLGGSNSIITSYGRPNVQALLQDVKAAAIRRGAEKPVILISPSP